jgi:hypothetical protein
MPKVVPIVPPGCPACLTGGGAAFATKLKLGQTREYAGPPCDPWRRRVDYLAQLPQNDVPVSEFANRRHDLSAFDRVGQADTDP